MLARHRPRLGACSLLLLVAACAPPPAGPPPTPPVAPLPPPEEAPPAACERILWIEIRKSERRLRAACEGGASLAWTVALGREPLGAKRAQGDLRTPEGAYRIARSRASRFHRFVPIDYPSLDDAARARGEGRLATRDYERIAAAHARGAPPPADTPLGGHLGLHGEGERWRGDSLSLDWTYGCVAMSDGEIDFLAEHAPPGTPVRIVP
jgi:murein L,D-transpeptidase YafK